MRKRLKGTIVSDKMDKTVVVQVDRYAKHPKYSKYQKRSKRYKVHDPDNKHKTGDKVTIEESKPISKDKKFVVVD